MMRIPAGSDLALVGGVLAEPGSGGDRIILWLPMGEDGKVRLWQRVSSVVAAEVVDSDGVSSLPATSYRARQRVLGTFGRLFGRSTDPGWAPPGGGAAERQGGRRTDLVLAWSDVVESAETRVRGLWPACEEVRRVGATMFVVSGVGGDRGTAETEPEAPESSPIARAETLLEAARKAGDESAEAAALADLGILMLKMGRPAPAAESLEASVAIYRRSGDQARTADAAAYLGSALLATGQPGRGVEMLRGALGLVTTLGDRFAEKLILERLSGAHVRLGDLGQSLACLERAIALCRALEDRRHEAKLLWLLAIRLAEAGRRDDAVAAARSSIDRLVVLGDDKAGWYEEHLKRFLVGPQAAGLGAVEATAPTSGPGALGMALSAGKAMAAFVGSGFKTVPPAVRRERLAICAGCEHHTGLRCRLCGCFTDAKARLPHEGCPIGRWPDPSGKRV